MGNVGFLRFLVATAEDEPKVENVCFRQLEGLSFIEDRMVSVKVVGHGRLMKLFPVTRLGSRWQPDFTKRRSFVFEQLSVVVMTALEPSVPASGSFTYWEVMHEFESPDGSP